MLRMFEESHGNLYCNFHIYNIMHNMYEFNWSYSSPWILLLPEDTGCQIKVLGV